AFCRVRSLFKLTNHWQLNQRSNIAAVNRNHGTVNIFASVPRQPSDQTCDRSRLHPLGNIRVRHRLSVPWRVHRSRQDHVGGQSSVFIFQGCGLNQRHHRSLGCAIGTNAGPRRNRRAASDGHDATAARFSQVWNCSTQHVKHTVQIKIQHLLEGRVIGFCQRLATRESPYGMGQDIQTPEARNHLLHQQLRAFASRNLGAHCRKVGAVECRLLYCPRRTDNGCTSLQESPRYVASQTTIRAGYKDNFPVHGYLPSIDRYPKKSSSSSLCLNGSRLRSGLANFNRCCMEWFWCGIRIRTEQLLELSAKDVSGRAHYRDRDWAIRKPLFQWSHVSGIAADCDL